MKILKKVKSILSDIVPSISNNKVNKELKEKIESKDASLKEFCSIEWTSGEENNISLEDIKQLYEKEITRKNYMEEKAKINIIAITIAITLIIGAYDLCENLYNSFSSPAITWIIFAFFSIGVLYMISAGIISIQTIVNENVVYLLDDSDLGLEEDAIAKNTISYIQKNRIQNIVRNNNINTSYICIRNALICLFIVFIMSVLPINHL